MGLDIFFENECNDYRNNRVTFKIKDQELHITEKNHVKSGHSQGWKI